MSLRQIRRWLVACTVVAVAHGLLAAWAASRGQWWAVAVSAAMVALFAWLVHEWWFRYRWVEADIRAEIFCTEAEG